MHGVANFVAKVLSSRLVPHLPKIIRPYICGSCLHENFQLVQGTARRLNSLGRSVVIFKLYITKALDTVDWAFLPEVLAKLGFGRRCLDMICGLLGSASMRVVLNRVVGSLIFNRRGL